MKDTYTLICIQEVLLRLKVSFISDYQKYDSSSEAFEIYNKRFEEV